MRCLHLRALSLLFVAALVAAPAAAEPPDEPEPAPSGYLEGMPWIAGGAMQAPPPGPPGLRTVVVAYRMSPAQLARTFRLMLEQSGWDVEVSPPSPRGTQRMVARKAGRSVRVSILAGPDGPGSSGLLLMPLSS